MADPKKSTEEVYKDQCEYAKKIAANMTPCPYCNNLVQKTDIKCCYCGQSLQA